MSTAVATPNELALSKPVSHENVTYVVMAKGEGKDEVINVITEDKVEDAVKEGYKEQSRQTFAFPSAGTEEGAKSIVPDEKERVLLFNRGLSVKLQNRARATMTARDEEGNYIFEPVEGAYDMTEIAASPTQRRGLSQEEKASRVLAGLTPDQLRSLFERAGLKAAA